MKFNASSEGDGGTNVMCNCNLLFVFCGSRLMFCNLIKIFFLKKEQGRKEGNMFLSFELLYRNIAIFPWRRD